MTASSRCIAVFCLLLLLAPGLALGQEMEQPETAPATPGQGFDLHITAPHIMGDRLVDPMHHYCKGISDAPVLQCLMFESDEPGARLVGVEYVIAKSITRPEVPLGDWNRNWHDHAVEIEAGVVGLPDLEGQAAADVAALAATTDGIVFMTWPEAESVPDEDVEIAQAISHEIMTPEEYAAYRQEAQPAGEDNR